MLRCKICGNELKPKINHHYVSRDAGKSGVITTLTKTEELIYDTFDCPVCGCQIIAQERKREIPQYIETLQEDNENAEEKNN